MALIPNRVALQAFSQDGLLKPGTDKPRPCGESHHHLPSRKQEESLDMFLRATFVAADDMDLMAQFVGASIGAYCQQYESEE